MSDQYKIIFSGELAPEKSLFEVKDQLSRALKLSDAAADRIFNVSKSPVVLKKTTSLEQAKKLSSKLVQLGLVVSIKKEKPSVENTIQVVEKEKSSLEPKLTLQAINEEPSVHDKDSSVQNTLLENLQQSYGLIIPLLIFLISLFFTFTYSPLGDGMLRPGFVVGAVLLILGIRFFRLRLL